MECNVDFIEKVGYMSYSSIVYYILIVEDNMPSAPKIFHGFANEIFHLLQVGYKQSCINTWLVTGKDLSLQ